MILDAEWAGLAARSESDQPHEWWPILWVIRNRMLDRNYPDTAQGVVTQAWQFSYFNEWRGRDDSAAVFSEAKMGYAGDHTGWHENDYTEAVVAAREVLTAGRREAPFGPKVLNFWSPQSMIPALILPDWNWEELRCFSLGGLDPSRFLFAESVNSRHPLADNINHMLGVNDLPLVIPTREATA